MEHSCCIRPKNVVYHIWMGQDSCTALWRLREYQCPNCILHLFLPLRNMFPGSQVCFILGNFCHHGVAKTWMCNENVVLGLYHINLAASSAMLMAVGRRLLRLWSSVAPKTGEFALGGPY